MSGKSITQTATALAFMLAVTLSAYGQKRGTITGTIQPASTDVIVVATNQVTSRTTRARADAAGHYELRLPVGAYRITVEAPFTAKFAVEKTYGEHALVRGDTLENVIVSADKQTKVDFTLEKRTAQQLATVPERKPPGATGQTSVPSEPQTQSDRRTVRDRWRIGFPEYDRYGDKGARGRDIPFKKGRWYDPYHQNWLKGDYPIIGNKVFMILSAVSSTSVDLSRTPKPSGVSSARPGSAEFFGKPEALSLNQIFQFTLEMFHGDSAYKPRDWAIKI